MSLAGWCALIVLLGAAFWWTLRAGGASRIAARGIERRLGGYQHQATRTEASRPRTLTEGSPRVAVIGSGLGGIGAAATLAERGVAVTVYEQNSYLGGKIGAWKEDVGGLEQTIEHGFHAFFRQYYNLNRFLARLGISDGFAAIEDYLIVDADGKPWSFGDIATVPALNILDLGRRGFFGWRDVTPRHTRERLEAFVRFDMTRTYEEFDGMTFRQLCDEAGLPDSLRVSFRTFARAFFSDEVELSAADVLRAFHFYYLSHDHGLMYDYPDGDYETIVLGPIKRHLAEHGVDLRLAQGVERLDRGATCRFRIGSEEYDWVVLAADIPGMQKIVAASPILAEDAPETVSALERLRTAPGYAVWRLWTDRDVRPGLPTFVNVERRRILDSVTLYHRITEEARDWTATHGGAVLELHSYAIDRGVEDVRASFLEDLRYYFPELGEMKIAHERLQVRHDFPAFAPGQWALRPEPKLPIEGLLVAGDWVRLPYPMTHMEAAFTSGLVCANEVLEALGLQKEPVFTVAPKGLLPPKRRAA